jgi:outer membrane biosynthesis protein TonB
MGGFVPKPIRPKPKPAPAPAPAPAPVPKPQPPKPTVVETTASQAADAQQMSDAIKTKRKGRRATILTDNEQLGGTTIATKTLLG